jgi:hypothetical protein
MKSVKFIFPFFFLHDDKQLNFFFYPLYCCPTWGYIIYYINKISKKKQRR